MISDTEHFFMCLLAMCIYSLEKYQFSYSAHFLIRLFVFLMLRCMICLYILNINPLLGIIFICFLPFLRLPFHFVSGFLCCAEAFWFDVVPFVDFFLFLLLPLLLVLSTKNYSPRQMLRTYPLCYCSGVLWF